MASLKNVLLIGAGGNLGVPVLQAFLNAPSYKVSVLARKESTSLFPEGITVFKADYANQPEVQVAMEGKDVVVSMVGGIAAGDQQVFIDAAIAAGVKRFFPSEFGPPSRDPKFAALNPYVLPPKAATVDYLRAKESQISWTSLVTGAFFDWALKDGFFGFDLATKTVGLIDNGTGIFTASTLPYIGKAVIAALEHAEETKNQYVFISSFNVSQRDILDVFEEVQGEKWTIEHLTSEEVIARGQKKLAEGDFVGIKDLTRGGAFGKQALGDSRPWGLWDDKLELEKEDIVQVVREVLASV
ncbi:isoflavone reductase [Ilyonectria destructans]|nr:isoflavone reductase [Ilyonectria destructans]